MKKLKVEWRHYDKEGQTCRRCADTGETLQQVLNDLAQELGSRGVNLVITETLLAESELRQSNLILLNGTPLEEILGDTKISMTSCPSCSTLAGAATDCRAIESGGQTYEDIPAELLRIAVYKVLEQ